jgi:hypothetical protein
MSETRREADCGLPHVLGLRLSSGGPGHPAEVDGVAENRDHPHSPVGAGTDQAVAAALAIGRISAPGLHRDHPDKPSA